MQTPYTVIGQSILRADGLDKVLGKAKYAADYSAPGMIYGKTLRSKVAHAVLNALDTSAAEALPGVYAVLTAADVPAANSSGIILKDEPICVPVGGKIRRMGDPLALVAAETEAIAEAALKLIKVDYTELPAIFDVEEALLDSAPKLYDRPNFILRHVEKGDVETAFSQAAVIIENEYRTQQVEHGYIEPEAGLAVFDGEIMTVWLSTQNPHYDAKEIARNLGIGMHKVRVVQTTTGGGFGGKLDMSVAVPAALLAKATCRPVKMIWTREESLKVSVKRHPYIIRIKHAAAADGKILGMTCTVYGDTGAYASYGPGVLTRAAVHSSGPYFIPALAVDAYTVFTNNPTAGAMRGFGVPQMSFAVESQMDLLAEKLGLTPLEVRLRNALRPGDSLTTSSILEQSVGIVATLEAASKRASEVMPSKHAIATGKKRGIGIGCMFYGCGNTGLPNPAGAFVDIMDDGTVRVLTGCADIGQGSDTVLRQIAAEEIGVPVQDVLVISGDTANSPDAGASSASRQTYISGNAVKRAAACAKENIYAMAADMLGVEPKDLCAAAGVISVAPAKSDLLNDCDTNCQLSLGIPAQKTAGSVTIKDVLGKCRAAGILTLGHGWFNPPTTGLEPQTGHGTPYGTYAFATQIAEVEVDEHTGQVEVLQIVACHDVGQAINPKQCEGQIEGGCIMGLGYALIEEIVHKKGNIVTDSLSTYLMPTSLDIPKIYAEVVEEVEASGPFGAKGLGEPTLIPTAAAIANAVAAAVGVRITRLPIAPEFLLTQMQNREQN